MLDDYVLWDKWHTRDYYIPGMEWVIPHRLTRAHPPMPGMVMRLFGEHNTSADHMIAFPINGAMWLCAHDPKLWDLARKGRVSIHDFIIKDLATGIDPD